VAIGVVVSQGSIHLSEREVADPIRNFLWTQPKLIPTNNALHSNACPGETWLSIADFR